MVSVSDSSLQWCTVVICVLVTSADSSYVTCWFGFLRQCGENCDCFPVRFTSIYSAVSTLLRLARRRRARAWRHATRAVMGCTGPCQQLGQPLFSAETLPCVVNGDRSTWAGVRPGSPIADTFGTHWFNAVLAIDNVTHKLCMILQERFMTLFHN